MLDDPVSSCDTVPATSICAVWTFKQYLYMDKTESRGQQNSQKVHLTSEGWYPHPTQLYSDLHQRGRLSESSVTCLFRPRCFFNSTIAMDWLQDSIMCLWVLMNLEVIAQKECLRDGMFVSARKRSGKVIFLLSSNIFKCSILVSFYCLPVLCRYLFLHQRADCKVKQEGLGHNAGGAATCTEETLAMFLTSQLWATEAIQGLKENRSSEMSTVTKTAEHLPRP